MSSFHSKYAAKALKKLEEERRLEEEKHKCIEEQHNAILFVFGMLAVVPLAIFLVVSILEYFI